MKIVYIDVSSKGHHKVYMKEIIEHNNCENILILPEKINDIECKQYIYSQVDMYNKRFVPFCNWINELKYIVEKECPDIVHFLYGDVFYKYFGYGLSQFKKYKTIVTMHWTKANALGMISAKSIASKVDMMVVHTEYMKKKFSAGGIKNIAHIEYPQFNIKKLKKKEAEKFWGINTDTNVIACIGGTRYDKGLDLLLDALNQVKAPFKLLIAGKAESFDEQFIRERAAGYIDNVVMKLDYLTDRELSCAINSADIIALPYRKMFTGASGPLTEGVCLDKIIVGPDHGSIGDIITANHLGYTFEAENVDSLADVMQKALSYDFVIDESYEEYKKRLSPEKFVKEYIRLYNELI